MRHNLKHLLERSKILPLDGSPDDRFHKMIARNKRRVCTSHHYSSLFR